MKKELRPKTPLINIYISNNDREYLNGIKNKYSLSYSTIINEMFNQWFKLENNKNTDHEKFEEKLKLLSHKMMQEIGTIKKTSIKPRLAHLMQNANISFINLLSNLVYLTRTNKIKKYCTNYENYKTNLYNSFEKLHDKYYSFNEYCRNMPKFIKGNRKYIKKLLGE